MRRDSLPESTVTHNSIDGQKMVSAYAPVEGGWTVGVAADARGLGIGPSAFLLTSLLAALAILGSLLLSYLNGRALTRRVRDLESKTKNVLTGAPIATTPPAFASSTASPTPWPGLPNCWRCEQSNIATPSRNCEAAKSISGFWPTACLNWCGPRVPTAASSTPMRVARNTERSAETDWEGIIHPDDRRATAEAWLRAREAAVPYEMEHRLFAIGKGYAWHLSRASPLLDAQGAVVRWYGTTTDIDDQKHREANIRDLMAEVNHRSRNLLAVAQAIARSGVANAKTVHEFQERYSERLLGLAASQDLLTDRNWRGVPLESLVRRKRRVVGKSALSAEGPQVLLSPNATQTLGLALRELCDNALKHGAFSKAGGEVSLVWRIDDSEAEPSSR